MARRGALVTGVDFSKSQLDFARGLAENAGIRVDFVLDDITSLSRIDSESFDVAISCFAVEYVENLEDFIRSTKRILRRNGFFILCDLHPAVSAIDLAAYDLQKEFGEQNYFSSSGVDFFWRTNKRDFHIRRYHRTLEEYFRSFRENDFVVDCLFEPKIEKLGKTASKCAYVDYDIDKEVEFWLRIPYTIVFVLKLIE